jgi:hypothetical protein
LDFFGECGPFSPVVREQAHGELKPVGSVYHFVLPIVTTPSGTIFLSATETRAPLIDGSISTADLRASRFARDVRDYAARPNHVSPPNTEHGSTPSMMMPRSPQRQGRTKIAKFRYGSKSKV